MKTNKKKSSARRKLLPAVAMLTVSAVSLSSATYAWFTMNKTVQVTGMQVRTKVGSNLLICSTNNEADYKSDTLLQGRRALLEPVSSINGVDGTFYYTVDAAADGKKIHATQGASGAIPFGTYAEGTAYANALAGKIKYDPTFNSVYTILESGTSPSGTGYDDGAPAYGYVDYTFYLKATGESAEQPINMTVCNLVYSGNGSGTQSLGSGTSNTGDQAWRVAVFAEEINNGGQGYNNTVKPASDVTNQKGLLALDGAEYFTSNKAVKEPSNATAMEGWLGTVINKADGQNENDTGVVIDKLAAGETNYYKVTVRLWLEGEDTTCTSETYAELTSDYQLDLKFELGQGTAVTKIGTDTTTASTIQNADPKISGADYDTQ